jgi:ribosomal protein S18 acetylase RimI-like enzyme
MENKYKISKEELEKAEEWQEKERRLNEESVKLMYISENWEETLEKKEFPYSHNIKELINDPVSFFDKDNLIKLKELSFEERIFILLTASQSFLTTSKQIKNYLDIFPDDRDVVSRNCLKYTDKRTGLDNSKYMNYRNDNLVITNLWASCFDSVIPVLEARGYSNGFLRLFSTYRNRAGKLILDGYSDLEVLDFIKNIESNKLKEVLKQAVSFQDSPNNKFWKGDPDIDKTEGRKLDFFSNGLDSLSDEERVDFIKKLISYIHIEILKKETNSDPRDGFELVSLGGPNFKNLEKSEYLEEDRYGLRGSFNSNINTSKELHWYSPQLFLFEAIEELGKEEEAEKNIDFLLDFWCKNRNPGLLSIISDSLSKLDANLSAKKILNKIKKNKNNDDSNHLTALLYRIELGKINISSAGVKYLEKIYDLGEYNNPNFHVDRLTVDGDVGIFNEELELIKYFNLEHSDNDDKIIKSKILDFTYETLFIGKNDESPEEKEARLVYLEEFKKEYYKVSSDKVFNSAGVSLNNLSFKEQGWFLLAFKEADDKEKDRIREFVSRNREDGIKAFLALNVNAELKEKIIDLGLNLDEITSRNLFSILARITSLASLQTEEIKKYYFVNDKKENISWEEIRLSLLDNVKKIITDFSLLLDNNGNNNLKRELYKIETEILFFKSILKSCKDKNKNINWEEIKDLNLSIKDYGQDLLYSDEDALLEIARENWGDFSNKNLSKLVLEGLEKSLDNNNNQRFYTLKYKDKIVSFVRFEKKDNGNIYAGSFNVSKDLRGLNIGTEMMEQALISEGRKNVLEAAASIKIPAVCSYVEKVGFVIDGIIEDYYKTGEPMFSINLNQENNKNYNFRIEGKETPITEKELKLFLVDYEDLEKKVGEPYIALSFNLKTDMEKYQKALSILLTKKDSSGSALESGKDKYTITRFFSDKEQGGDTRFLVFERNK